MAVSGPSSGDSATAALQALPREVDLLVVGSGAAALSAAVTAAAYGLTVVVLEKEPVLGGTTAWSAGAMWIPNSPMAVEKGHGEAVGVAQAFLRDELGEPAFTQQAEKIDAYLADGPAMLHFFQSGNAGTRRFEPLAFDVDGKLPDFHDTPHARSGWRCVRARAFDGRRLKRDIDLLRPPLDLLTIWGMGIETGRDLRHFQNAGRSLKSLVHVIRRLCVHLRTKRDGRGMSLVNGNALVAGLMFAARQLGVELRPSSAVLALVSDDESRVVGVRFHDAYDVPGELRSRRGVVLACGGFPHDNERKRRLMPHAPTGAEHHSAAPASNTGDGLRLGESVSGVVRPTLGAAAVWAPVSLLRRRDGSTAAYPHLIERGKPGLVAVDRGGERFGNEAASYHDFVATWLRETPLDGPAQAWLVCDRCCLWRYGLGAIKPFSVLPLWLLRSGYLKWSLSIDGLARACGIDAPGLRATVEAWNATARDGQDPRFHKGWSVHDRAQGDPRHKPNACVAPIERRPYFAVRLHPGSLGTFAGLHTDAHGRVLDRREQPIAGLYACGNDMASVFGGVYPASGLTLGAAMIFGHRSARAAVAERNAAVGGSTGPTPEAAHPQS